LFSTLIVTILHHVGVDNKQLLTLFSSVNSSADRMVRERWGAWE